MHYRVQQTGEHIENLVIDITDLGLTMSQIVTKEDGSTAIEERPIQQVTPQWFEFSLERYTKLNRVSIEESRLPVNNVLEPVNRFFQTLSKTDQTAIAMTIFNLHVSIYKKMNENTRTSELNIFMKEEGKALLTLDDSIQFIKKISEFVHSSVPLGDFSEIGTREQDTQELTFRESEVHDLSVIAVLNKMMSPLFSVCMNILRNKKDINCELGYELPCAFLLTEILNRYYQDLIVKFKNYIRHNITKKTSFIGSDAAVMLHYTSNTVELKTYAQLLVRSLVNVDLYSMNRNLMSFVSRSIQDSMNSMGKGVNEYPVFIRKPPAKHQDEDTSGYLDVSSAVSNTPLEAMHTTTNAVWPTIGTVLSEYVQFMSESDFKDLMKYYRMNPVIPNDFNRFFVGSVFRCFLGGTQTISQLKSSNMNPLFVCLQLLAVKRGLFELAHCITARRSSNSCTENMAFSSNYRGKNYETVRQIFEEGPIGFMSKRFDAKMNAIVKDLATHYLFFNSSPEIWDISEHESMNGKPIAIQQVIEEACNLMLFVQEIEKQKVVPITTFSSVSL